MANHPRSVDQAIARFEEVMHRIDRGTSAGDAQRRLQARRIDSMRSKLGNIGMAIGVLIAATLVFGFVVGPIGITGLFVVAVLMFLAVLVFSVLPGESAP